MKLARIIHTDKAEYGELFDSDYESLGEHWHYSLDPNDDEGPAITVGDFFEVTATNKKSYSLRKPGHEPPDKLKKMNKNWRRSYSMCVPKEYVEVLSDKEAKLYEYLFE